MIGVTLGRSLFSNLFFKKFRCLGSDAQFKDHNYDEKVNSLQYHTVPLGMSGTLVHLSVSCVSMFDTARYVPYR